jgi:hypothetical protein
VLGIVKHGRHACMLAITGAVYATFFIYGYIQFTWYIKNPYHKFLFIHMLISDWIPEIYLCHHVNFL